MMAEYMKVLLLMQSGNVTACTGRRNPPTKTIRIPAKYADRLIEMAREWEEEELLKVMQ
jgi:hypothetical protein